MKYLGIFLLALIGIPFAGFLFFVVFQPIKVLPRVTLAPGFANLQDQHGNPLDSEQLRGDIVLYSFTYTNCTTELCGQTVQLLKDLQLMVASRHLATPVRIVTFSLDPQHDTPATLRAYGEQQAIDWALVTGDEKQLRAAVSSLGVYAKRDATGFINYDSRITIAAGGFVRAEYPTYLPTVNKLLNNIEMLNEEAQNSVGVAGYAYEAAHIFGCYVR